MLKVRTEVMRAVAAPLIQSEKLVDAAIAELTTVMVATIEGRAKAKLPLDAGQAALDQIMAALQQLITGRKAIHAAHADFAGVKDRMGLARVAASADEEYGDKGDTPREMMITEAGPALTLVSNAA